MIYKYINDETEAVIEKEFSMNGDIPAVVMEDGVKFRRSYDMDSISISIPFGWGQNRVKFDKSPSGRKHFY